MTTFAELNIPFPLFEGPTDLASAGWPGLDHREAPVECCRAGFPRNMARMGIWSRLNETPPLKPGQFSVSNKTVIAIMTVTMAWVIEFFVIAMHLVGKGKIPIALQAAILPVMLFMTIACVKWARAEVIAHTPGRSTGLMLTPIQSLIVVLFMVGFELPIVVMLIKYF